MNQSVEVPSYVPNQSVASTPSDETEKLVALVAALAEEIKRAQKPTTVSVNMEAVAAAAEKIAKSWTPPSCGSTCFCQNTLPEPRPEPTTVNVSGKIDLVPPTDPTPKLPQPKPHIEKPAGQSFDVSSEELSKCFEVRRADINGYVVSDWVQFQIEPPDSVSVQECSNPTTKVKVKLNGDRGSLGQNYEVIVPFDKHLKVPLLHRRSLQVILVPKDPSPAQPDK